MNRRVTAVASFMAWIRAPFADYLGELAGWARKLCADYALAAALLALALLFFFILVAIGLAAGFYALEGRYGIFPACTIMGGCSAVLMLASFAVGWRLLKRGLTPLPGPQKQIRRAAHRAAIKIGVLNERRGLTPLVDPAAKLLAAGAIVFLSAWFLSTGLLSRKESDT